MILFGGRLFDDSCQDRLIRCLPRRIFRTRLTLAADTVINACDRLAARVMRGEFRGMALPLLQQNGYSESDLAAFAQMFTAEGLRRKLRAELGDETVDGGFDRVRKRLPLGALLHIAAGNMDVLPAYSVAEGLLAGNINVLKLPSADSGLTVFLLEKLIEEEPRLKDYIYVFDVPSSDVRSVQMMAAACNAAAVWGGDEAAAAVRRLCPPDMRIIEWGHKLSFAYASPHTGDEELGRLAEHICCTNSLLCSSCQGIFLDTASRSEQLAFAERFFEILKNAAKTAPPLDVGIRARNTLARRTAELEQTDFFGGGVSVVAPADSRLEISGLYRSIWVKRLPADRIFTLRQYKMHLQTAAVMTGDTAGNRAAAGMLAECGVVRILRPENMSQTLVGEAHDGRYALREYSRTVEFDTDFV